MNFLRIFLLSSLFRITNSEILIFYNAEYDSDPDLESLWCADSPKKTVASQKSIQNTEISESDGSISSCQLKATETGPNSPNASNLPARFLSPSIRINLPSYAAFSSTPNLSSPSWQKIASANGEQSFSFSFDMDNYVIKNSDVDHELNTGNNQSMEYNKADTQDNTVQNDASHIVLNMSPSVDSGIDVSLRSNHTMNNEQSTTIDSSFCIPTSVGSGLRSAVPLSSHVSIDPTTPKRYRRPSGLVPFETITKSIHSRSALVSITNTIPHDANSSICANVKSRPSSTATSNGKRKSSHDLGNENKTRVVSP